MAHEDIVIFITKLSCSIILFELLIRIFFLPSENLNTTPCHILLLAYCICVVSYYVHEGLKFELNSEMFKCFLGFLQGLDGVWALMIGLAIYYKSQVWLLVGWAYVLVYIIKCVYFTLSLSIIPSFSLTHALSLSILRPSTCHIGWLC